MNLLQVLPWLAFQPSWFQPDSKLQPGKVPPWTRPPGIPVREFPGIADPKIPGGNSREFLKFWRELRGISRVLSFFTIFIVDYDILVFNLTAFWAKPWMTSFTQLFVFIEFQYTFKYWYRKITELRQNFANSDRYTNEDAEIILIGHRQSFCIHRLGMEGVLRKMF